MSAEFFIDTHVFVHRLDTSDPKKTQPGRGLRSRCAGHGQGCISTQVVQECLNVALRKAEVVLSTDAARRYLQVVLAPLVMVAANEALYHRALDVQARWRFSFHDSLIVAGAMTAGCRTLLSEDLQHGQLLDGLRVVNPFLG